MEPTGSNINKFLISDLIYIRNNHYGYDDGSLDQGREITS